MRDDKAQVLGQIRVALQTAHLPAARASVPARSVIGEGDRAALIENFRRELEPIGGLSYLAHNDEEAIDIVLNLLRPLDNRQLLMWDESELPVRGLGEALRTNGYTSEKIDLPMDPAARKNRLLELAHAGAGITGALAGLSDTGSLALVSSAAHPRLASLLPSTHIALLPTSKLFPNMATLFATYPNVTRDASNLVLVTGPSRTADIELTLQRGVHGPKFLHVVLIEG